jgi:predicted O-methyltransferase YrrM
VTAALFDDIRRACARGRDRRAEADISWCVRESPRDDWVLDVEALSVLTTLVGELEPQRVLEFGSGMSTCALARAAARLSEPAVVTSLENDPDWLRRTGEMLRADRLGAGVDLRFCPVVVRRWHGHHVPIYHVDGDDLFAGMPPDFVLVDGPPMPLGGREGAIYQALRLSRPGTVVLVDDAKRDSEQHALARAHEVFADAIEIDLWSEFPKGLAMILVLAELDLRAAPGE